jgi:acyl carrier protein
LTCLIFSGCLVAQLRIDADFQEDLGLDSLDVVECVMMIEEEFSIELDDTQAELIKSPQDMINYILH